MLRRHRSPKASSCTHHSHQCVLAWRLPAGCRKPNALRGRRITTSSCSWEKECAFVPERQRQRGGWKMKQLNVHYCANRTTSLGHRHRSVRLPNLRHRSGPTPWVAIGAQLRQSAIWPQDIWCGHWRWQACFLPSTLILAPATPASRCQGRNGAQSTSFRDEGGCGT